MSENEPMWYYAKGNQQYGPVAASVVRQMLSSGELSPTDLVWTSGMGQWEEARRVPGLVPEPQQAAAPPPPPPSWGQPQPVRPGPVGYQPAQYVESQHGKAVAAFVCSIFSLICAPAGIGFVLGIVAIFLGSNATTHMARTGNFEGRGLAKAGFIIGIVGVCLSATVCGGFGVSHHHFRFR